MSVLIYLVNFRADILLRLKNQIYSTLQYKIYVYILNLVKAINFQFKIFCKLCDNKIK